MATKLETPLKRELRNMKLRSHRLSTLRFPPSDESEQTRAETRLHGSQQRTGFAAPSADQAHNIDLRRDCSEVLDIEEGHTGNSQQPCQKRIARDKPGFPRLGFGEPALQLPNAVRLRDELPQLGEPQGSSCL
jgi:hypothetical protein